MSRLAVTKNSFIYLDFLRLLRLVFIKVSSSFHKFGRFSLRKKIKLVPLHLRRALKPRKPRRYIRRFYRRIFRSRYIKSFRPSQLKILKINETFLFGDTVKTINSMKPFFHIKNIFNLNEFLMYDFYNFHKNRIHKQSKGIPRRLREYTTKFWKKINFFYYIRDSIDVFRTHTLQFFKLWDKTDRRNTLVFKGFRGFSPLAYIWFFEFSLTYFLIKIRFSESMPQSLVMVLGGVVFINGSSSTERWDPVHPGNFIQLVFSPYLLLRLRKLIIQVFKFLRKTRKFLRKTILRSRKYRIKLPYITSKSQYMVANKPTHFRLFEIDYKSASAVLLPLKSPKIYLSAITMFWTNFWNYRLTIWKYDI